MDRVKVAVVGTGPAGMVAAFALHNDPEKKFDVTLFEAGSGMSLDSHSYELADPKTGYGVRIDVPMRVFSGRYYQNLFYLLDYLSIPSVKRSFLFAFVDTFSTYYFFHWSNNHRLPRLCRQRPGIFGAIAAVWMFFKVLACYAWFSFACFWIPPRVRGMKHAKTETMGEYLARLRLPTFFVEDYMVPLFSSVASSPHKLFLEFPAVYLTDYKRLTHLYPHRTSVSMALVQDRLGQGMSPFYNTRVTKVEPIEGRLKVHYKNTSLGTSGDTIFDRVVLAINPKEISAIHPRSSYVMSQLATSEVRVVIHRDYSLLPANSAKVINDNDSELLAMQVKLDAKGGKTTVATHVHPTGVLVTVWPGNQDIAAIDPTKVLSESKFVRLLATSKSRDYLLELFSEKFATKREGAKWVNGEDGIYIAGGWAWDGFALLEGCVWSGLETARSIGATLPFKPVERKWR